MLTPRRLILLALLVGLAWPRLAFGHGSSVVIAAPATASAGGVICVTISSTGPASGLAISVEVNGVALPASSVSTSSPSEGTIVVCFRIPAAAEGGSVTVTATDGGEHASSSIQVTSGD